MKTRAKKWSRTTSLATASKRPGRQSRRGGITGWILAAVVIAALCCAVSRHLVQLTLIRGESMLPTYRPMEFVWVDRVHREFARGDVVAFRSETLDRVLVKRVAGVPGDQLVISENTLWVNGERQTGDMCREDGGDAEETFRLPAGFYYVLGDNRQASVDSRDARVGLVAESAILGRVMPGRRMN